MFRVYDFVLVVVIFICLPGQRLPLLWPVWAIVALCAVIVRVTIGIPVILASGISVATASLVTMRTTVPVTSGILLWLQGG